MKANVTALDSTLAPDFKKVHSGRAGKIVRLIIVYVVMTVFAAVFLIPYIFMFLRAFSGAEQVAQLPVRMWPKPWTGEAFIALFREGNYFKYTLQTLKIVGFNIIAIPLSSSFVAYGFSKTKFFGKKVIFTVMMSTMMLPGAVLQVPLYVLFARYLHWTDTILPLTIPNLFGGGAIYIFLVRQYMVSIPRELEEAARLDGANPFLRYFLITLPLCVPVLIFVMITVFNSCWSDFYGPLVYIGKEGAETLAYAVFKDAIYKYVSPIYVNLKMAGGLFMSIFPTILFVIFQKQLIEGVSTSALKG